jgi:protein-tyrosine-phosphatase
MDISDRTPRQITAEDVADAEYVVTMGCDASGFTPKDWDGTTEQWDLTDPHGEDLEGVREQRDEIKHRVSRFFDKLEN